jgi:hypothetical protein
VSLLTVRLLTAPLLTLPLGQAPPSAFMTGFLGQPGRRGAAPGQPPVPRTGFSRLVAAATVSGLGDGMTQVAGALLTLTLTRSPLLVAGLLAAQQLPWVLGALPAGALVDRVDRRRAMAAACLVRAAALGTLGLLAAAGRTGLPVLYLVFLLAGGAGVVYENAATALLPALVDRARLTRANGQQRRSAGRRGPRRPAHDRGRPGCPPLARPRRHHHGHRPHLARPRRRARCAAPLRRPARPPVGPGSSPTSGPGPKVGLTPPRSAAGPDNNEGARGAPGRELGITGADATWRYR